MPERSAIKEKYIASCLLLVLFTAKKIKEYYVMTDC